MNLKCEICGANAVSAIVSFKLGLVSRCNSCILMGDNSLNINKSSCSTAYYGPSEEYFKLMNDYTNSKELKINKEQVKLIKEQEEYENTKTLIADNAIRIIT